MRVHSFAGALSMFIALTSPALHAGPVVFESDDTPATLIELFTSEGCSSCPPAETWMSGLKSSPDLWKRVVPVAFHVDYWNSLGWADRFASGDYTARQRRYVAGWSGDSIYTPGFVLNGREWRDWFEHRTLPKPSTAKVGKLTLTLRETEVEVAFTGARDTAKAPSLCANIAFLAGNLESDVARGENRGRKLQHDFTVIHFTSAPLRSNGEILRATVSRPTKFAIAPDAIAAWIAPGETQPPIQATGGWLDH
jgi:hypothetical protein